MHIPPILRCSAGVGSTGTGDSRPRQILAKDEYQSGPCSRPTPRCLRLGLELIVLAVREFFNTTIPNRYGDIHILTVADALLDRSLQCDLANPSASGTLRRDTRHNLPGRLAKAGAFGSCP